MTGSNGRLGWIMACFAAAQIGTLELAAASSAGDTPFLDDPRENLSGSIYAAEKRFDHPKRPSPLASAQEAELLVYIENGEDRRVPLGFSGPSATVPVAVFRSLGWSLTGGAGPDLLLQGPEGVQLEISVGSPFVKWNGTVIHLIDPPHRAEGEVQVPLQLLSEVVVDHLGELYVFDAATLTISAAGPDRWGGRQNDADSAEGAPKEMSDEKQPISDPPEDIASGARYEVSPPVVSGKDDVRVVVIDPGHGGGDPGAIGVNGTREKEIALAVGLELERALKGLPGIEVHMTRSSDRFVPIWERGELATKWKGDRPGVFISLHANSLPNFSSIRGFETYSLAESRTDHERRIAAIENSPLSVPGQEVDIADRPALESILRDLRTLEFEHWSSLLAEMVQSELAEFPPGPARRVHQGVLAVLTNALMPSVLVELGYISNADEAPILTGTAFQRSAAEAIAQAVLRFLERYPPGVESRLRPDELPG